MEKICNVCNKIFCRPTQTTFKNGKSYVNNISNSKWEKMIYCSKSCAGKIKSRFFRKIIPSNEF